jgi:KipI family sensor histidine kinase inhibitor
MVMAACLIAAAPAAEGIFRCRANGIVLGRQTGSETMMDAHLPTLPLILPLGDRGLLVRFSGALSEDANRAAVAFGQQVAAARLLGVVEVVPNLVSVLLRYEPTQVEFDRLAGEVRLLVAAPAQQTATGREHGVAVTFDGEDLDEVARIVKLSRADFVAAHCRTLLRVLATGFAPGFVYTGFHESALRVPRRAEVRRQVPPGTVLFAAGQTAITSTAIPTGWHVIGRTGFRNFDPAMSPPTRLDAGDLVRFEAVT